MIFEYLIEIDISNNFVLYMYVYNICLTFSRYLQKKKKIAIYIYKYGTSFIHVICASIYNYHLSIVYKQIKLPLKMYNK